MARKIKSNRERVKADVEAAARKAADEAIEDFQEEAEDESFDSPEERDMFTVQTDRASSSQQELDAKDVWFETERKAVGKGLGFSTRIYLDGVWVGTKRGPFPKGWEGIREEFPQGGYFKGVGVDSENKFLCSQSIQIAPRPEWVKQQNNPRGELSDKEESPAFGMLEIMKENQREAEAKAQSQQLGIATMMQAITTANAESNRIITTMMMENAKQTQQMMLALIQNNNSKPTGPDPMMTLVTTLLTKEKPKEGMGFAEVLKMLADKERDTKAAVEKQYELIEKKSDALAEIKAEAMAGGDGEEKPAGLLGTLVPMFTQIMAQQAQANQGTPEQQMARRMELERQQNGTPKALNEGFREAPPLPTPEQLRRQQAERQGARAPVQRPDSGQPVRNPQSQVQNSKPVPQDFVLEARQKEAVINFVGLDIAQAMMAKAPASDTADLVVKKLEIENVTRQTILKSFTLEEFGTLVESYGIQGEQLTEAKAWLKEFYESIQTPSSKPTGTLTVGAPTTPSAKAPETVNGNGQHVNGAAKPVAPVGNKPAVTRTRKTAREPSKDL